jgi:hypothetical protein
MNWIIFNPPFRLDRHKYKTINEQNDGVFHNVDNAVAAYNNDMTEITKDVKAFAFTEILNQPLYGTDTLFTIDVNKCGTCISKDGIFAYPVFSVFDASKVYENEICPGIHYVNKIRAIHNSQCVVLVGMHYSSMTD